MSEYQRLKDVMAEFDVSRATVYRWIREHDFPRPIKMGPGASRWIRAETQEWARSRPRMGDRRS